MQSEHPVGEQMEQPGKLPEHKAHLSVEFKWKPEVQ